MDRGFRSKGVHGGGVLPHSTYGTELVEVPAKELAELRRQWVAAAGQKPIDTPRDLRIMMLGVARGPAAKFPLLLLLRRSRTLASAIRPLRLWIQTPSPLTMSAFSALSRSGTSIGEATPSHVHTASVFV